MQSIYQDELVALGFDSWSEEEITSLYKDLGTIDVMKVPCFWHFAFKSVSITFAIDENQGFWVAEHIINLSGLGFHEAELLIDDTPRKFLN